MLACDSEGTKAMPDSTNPERRGISEYSCNPEELLRILFEEAPEAMFLTDPQCRLIDVNTRAIQLTGYARDELLGRHIIALFHPEDIACHPVPMKELAAGEVTLRERRLIRKDGNQIWVENRFRMLPDGNLLGISLEITDRKREEQVLQMFRYCLDHASDAIEWFDREGRFTYANEQECRSLGYTAEELAQLSLWEIDPLYGKERWDNEWQEFQKDRQGGGVFVETLHKRKDGTLFPVEVSSKHLWFGDTELHVAFVRDITQRKQAEDEKERLRNQLLQSQKMQSIETLAGGVAHEINNPINGIMNYAQLILDRIEPDHPAEEYARGILHETKRISRIVRNLLTFARHEKQAHSPARMHEIMAAVYSLIQAVARHDQIALELEVPEDLPVIECRCQQIQQVLMNLMTNARDALNERYPGYSPDKKLRIAARVITKEGRRFIRTTVEDTGTGIPEDIRDRIFDPFFTTKPQEIGTGLGLAISYGIVKDHGGSLSVESELLRYTRFHMDLPMDDEE